jgi:hypothetical protein
LKREEGNGVENTESQESQASEAVSPPPSRRFIVFGPVKKMGRMPAVKWM